ncbi:hypothetical protein KQX61_07220 [Rhodopseudomonas palustris]|nr:hypothetical protein KQX61_07220 [Rhodopseudomonas palustris]
MFWSETLRNRHNEPGYVYIAGSLSQRLLKIGTTVNIRSYQKYLNRTGYGGIRDWVLLYHVWVEAGGKIEHDARRPLLRKHQQLRMYDKEGHIQKARELVDCRFSIALDALESLLTATQRASAWRSMYSGEYEFGWTPPPHDVVTPRPPPSGIPATVHLLRRLDDFELSVRTQLRLESNNIRFVGEVVQKTVADLLGLPYFGRKSLNEIERRLAEIGLQLDMAVPGWPPEDLDLASRKASKMLVPIDELEFSVRTANCLKNSGIHYIGELIRKTEAELLSGTNFGRKSLNEINAILAEDSLTLGVDLDSWPLP